MLGETWSGARSLCRLIETTGKEAPLLVIAHEGGLAALSADWGFDDLVLTTAGPAEVDVRLRLAMTPAAASNADPVIQSGNIMIDEAGYSAKLNGVQLDLTYTEFELLKYLAQHPGRVFSRQQLLSDVGSTTTTAAPVRSTYMCGDCAQSSARSTNPSSALCETSVTASLRQLRSRRASPARAWGVSAAFGSIVAVTRTHAHAPDMCWEGARRPAGPQKLHPAE